MDQEKIVLLVGVTADVVSAYVSNNPVHPISCHP